MLLFTTTSSTGIGHQDNISLNPMINSIEVALYSSGIMRVPSLLSSSTPCTWFGHSQLREHHFIPWFPHISPNEVLKERSEEVINAWYWYNALLVPLSSFGVSDTVKEIQ